MAHTVLAGAPLPDAASPSAALRITVVTETYPPEVNGVALTLAEVVRGLRARGHCVRLVRPRQAGDPDALRALDATSAEPGADLLLHGLPIPMYRHLRMGLPAARALAAQWRRERPDLVHVATEGPLGWSAVRAAQRLGIAVTSDFRTNFHAYTQHYGLAWLGQPILGYLRHFHNRTAVTMVPTEALRARLARQGFQRLAVVSRGVDIARFNPQLRSAALRRHWGAHDDDLVVLHVGRLAAEKNLGLLVQGFRAIQQRHPRARLVLVGDGPLRDTLRAECPQAVFAGQRHGTELATHYASADLFLFPSLTETFGNVTPEAMASGLPVVAFDYAAAAQLVTPGVSGVLVPPGDARAFEAAALALAERGAARAAMGAQARQAAARHDWPQVLSRFEHVLRHALGHPGRGGAETNIGSGLVRDPRVVAR
jgi:glycosyltransferase involved in cell wall biosynthesis